MAQSGLKGEDAKRLSDTLTSSIVAGLLTGTSGSDAGAYASNELKYNYLTAEQLSEYKKALAKCETAADYESCAKQVWFEGNFNDAYMDNRDNFEDCIAANDNACIDKHINNILEARNTARDLRQSMVEKMHGNNKITEPNNYALDIIRSYYYGFDPEEVVIYRDMYCGGSTSPECLANLKRMADQRNKDSLQKLTLFTLAGAIGLTVAAESAAACLASQVCTAFFAMADAGLTLQACAGGDVTSCGSFGLGKGLGEITEKAIANASKHPEVFDTAKHVNASVINSLFKDGQLIGYRNKGSNYLIRTVSPEEFSQLKNQLLKGAKEVEKYGQQSKVTWYNLPNGGQIGVRDSKKHGLTLDFNIPGIHKNFKIHQK